MSTIKCVGLKKSTVVDESLSPNQTNVLFQRLQLYFKIDYSFYNMCVWYAILFAKMTRDRHNMNNYGHQKDSGNPYHCVYTVNKSYGFTGIYRTAYSFENICTGMNIFVKND